MRRSSLVAILALFAVVLSFPPLFAAEAADPAEPAEPAPAAVVAKPIIDAGQVLVGEPIEVEFLIENRGDAPLEIIRVQPACGCTVAEYDETIAPGATGKVKAVVDTTGESGQNSKLITVATNDPENARIQLAIQSDVKTFLSVNPGYARFPSFVHNDKDQTIAQVLWTEDFPDLEIEEIETPQPWIEVSHREASETERSEKGLGKQWRLDVTVSSEAPVGPVAEMVLVRTNHPQQAEVQIPVSGFVRPMIAVTPPHLNLGRIDPSQAKPWGVLVRNFGSAPLAIEGAQSTIAGMDVSVEPLQEGQQFRLVLTATPDMAQGPFQGQVELETNLPQQPKITVDVRGEVQPSEGTR